MMRRFFIGSIALVAASLAFTGDGLAQQPAAAAQPSQPSAGGQASATAPASPPPPTVEQAIQKVQSFYDKTTSFKADFNQEFFVKAYNKKKTSNGTVTFAKPGKMDWVYQNPQGNRVVSDGTLLRVYEAQNHQMFEQAVDKSQYPAALSFLTGQGKLSDHFTFEISAGDKMNFPGGYVLIGTPKVPTAAYQKVLFYIDQQTSQVRRVMVLDGQGNRNRFDFVNPRVNDPVQDAQFKFVPPPGTTVVHP